MKASDEGLELIRKAEGLKLVAYRCPAGEWTIGYGHTSGVKRGMTISVAEAEKFLRADVEEAEKAINAMHVQLRQTQFDALVSFVFNVGAARFKTSTMRRKIIAGASDKEVAAEFARWKFSTGEISVGLVNRRKREAALYLR